MRLAAGADEPGGSSARINSGLANVPASSIRAPNHDRKVNDTTAAFITGKRSKSALAGESRTLRSVMARRRILPGEKISRKFDAESQTGNNQWKAHTDPVKETSHAAKSIVRRVVHGNGLFCVDFAGFRRPKSSSGKEKEWRKC